MVSVNPDNMFVGSQPRANLDEKRYVRENPSPVYAMRFLSAACTEISAEA